MKKAEHFNLPSEMFMALANLGGSCAAAAAEAALPAAPVLVPMPACMALRAGPGLCGNVGNPPDMEAPFPEGASPLGGPTPVCMPFRAVPGLWGNAGNAPFTDAPFAEGTLPVAKGLSSGGLRKGFACL